MWKLPADGRVKAAPKSRKNLAKQKQQQQTSMAGSSFQAQPDPSTTLAAAGPSNAQSPFTSGTLSSAEGSWSTAAAAAAAPVTLSSEHNANFTFTSDTLSSTVPAAPVAFGLQSNIAQFSFTSGTMSAEESSSTAAAAPVVMSEPLVFGNLLSNAQFSFTSGTMPAEESSLSAAAPPVVASQSNIDPALNAGAAPEEESMEKMVADMEAELGRSPQDILSSTHIPEDPNYGLDMTFGLDVDTGLVPATIQYAGQDLNAAQYPDPSDLASGGSVPYFAQDSHTRQRNLPYSSFIAGLDTAAQDPFDYDPFASDPFAPDLFAEEPFAQDPFAQDTSAPDLSFDQKPNFVLDPSLTLVDGGGNNYPPFSASCQHPVPSDTQYPNPNVQDNARFSTHFNQDSSMEDPDLPRSGLHQEPSFNPSLDIAQDSYAQSPMAQGPLGQVPFAQDAFSQYPFVQDPPAQDSLAQEPITQDPSVHDTLAKDPLAWNPFAQDALAQDALAQDALAQDALAQDVVAQDPFAKDSCAQDSLAQVPLAEISLAQDSLVQDSLSQVPSAQNPFAQDPLAQDTFAKDPCAQDSLAQVPLAEVSLAQDALAQGPSAQNSYAQDQLVHDLLVQVPSARNPFTQDPLAQDPFQDPSLGQNLNSNLDPNSDLANEGSNCPPFATSIQPQGPSATEYTDPKVQDNARPLPYLDQDTSMEDPDLVHSISYQDPLTQDPSAQEPLTRYPIAYDSVAKVPIVQDPVAHNSVVAQDPFARDSVAQDPVAHDSNLQQASVFPLALHLGLANDSKLFGNQQRLPQTSSTTSDQQVHGNEDSQLDVMDLEPDFKTTPLSWKHNKVVEEVVPKANAEEKRRAISAAPVALSNKDSAKFSFTSGTMSAEESSLPAPAARETLSNKVIAKCPSSSGILSAEESSLPAAPVAMSNKDIAKFSFTSASLSAEGSSSTAAPVLALRKEDNDKCQREIRKLRAEIDRKNKQISDRDDKIRQSAQELQDQDTKNMHLIKQYLSDLDEIRKEKSTLEEANHSLARENLEAKENHDKARSDKELMRKLNCELGKIRRKQSALVKEKESLAKDCSELRGESDQLRESNSVLKEENSRLRASLDDLRSSSSELVEAKDTIRAQEAEIKNSAQKIATLSACVDEISPKLLWRTEELKEAEECVLHEESVSKYYKERCCLLWDKCNALESAGDSRDTEFAILEMEKEQRHTKELKALNLRIRGLELANKRLAQGAKDVGGSAESKEADKIQELPSPKGPLGENQEPPKIDEEPLNGSLRMRLRQEELRARRKEKAEEELEQGKASKLRAADAARRPEEVAAVGSVAVEGEEEESGPQDGTPAATPHISAPDVPKAADDEVKGEENTIAQTAAPTRSLLHNIWSMILWFKGLSHIKWEWVFLALFIILVLTVGMFGAYLSYLDAVTTILDEAVYMVPQMVERGMPAVAVRRYMQKGLAAAGVPGL